MTNQAEEHATTVVSLVVPGSSERMLSKARQLRADELVIDLEDAVLPERKAEALALVIATLASGASAPRTVVRINAPRSPWAHVELTALATAPVRPSAVVIPKVSNPGDLAFAERLLDGAERNAADAVPIRLQALIETASGLSDMHAIAHGSPRLEALILGYVDLAAALGRSLVHADNLDSWIAAQHALVLAARTAGLRAIDGPSTSINDLDRLGASANRAAELGFDGKWAIHPSQLDVIRDAFRPGEAEIGEARRILDVLGTAAHHGLGAASLDGKMIDEAVRLTALRTLARAGFTDQQSGAPG